MRKELSPFPCNLLLVEQGYVFLRLLFFVVFVIGCFVLAGNGTAFSLPGDSAQMQFVSASHVLSFDDSGLTIVSQDHALSVMFGCADQAGPVSVASDMPSGLDQTAALGSVRYSGLWSGVDLVYEGCSGGIVKSTYYIAPHNGSCSPVETIRLAFNVPVSLDGHGNLIYTFETGFMTESAPTAWQYIDGVRVPVEVAFELSGSNEIGFDVGVYDSRYELVIDPTLVWNTFLGGSGQDNGRAIATDSSGNIYVAGCSSTSWGSPVNAFVSGGDNNVFVAKLSSSGTLVWNTFIGTPNYNEVGGIVEKDGGVYVTGASDGTWGSPVNSYNAYSDIFVAKLDAASGAVAWSTFLGSSGDDAGKGLAVADDGATYVIGTSDTSWGSPLTALSGSTEAFMAKLDGSGTLVWNTFFGGSAVDIAFDIVYSAPSSFYVAGLSYSGWGSPVTAFSGGQDAFLIKVESTGTVSWSTFMGGSGDDRGLELDIDSSGYVYVAGTSDASWGSPVDNFNSDTDLFVTKLCSTGYKVWNTFVGSYEEDSFGGFAVSSDGKPFISGFGFSGWGSPVVDYEMEKCDEVFVGKLSRSGKISWNTFFGSYDNDICSGLALTPENGVLVLGDSPSSWGSPVAAHGGSGDTFVARLACPVLTGNISDLDNCCGLENVLVSVADASGTAITCKRFDIRSKTEDYEDDLTGNNIVARSVYLAPNIGIVRDVYAQIIDNCVDMHSVYQMSSYSNSGSTPHEYLPLENGNYINLDRYDSFSYGVPGNVRTSTSTETCLGSRVSEIGTYWGIEGDDGFGTWLNIYRVDGDDVYEVHDFTVDSLFGFSGGEKAAAGNFNSDIINRISHFRHSANRSELAAAKTAGDEPFTRMSNEYLNFSFDAQEGDRWGNTHSVYSSNISSMSEMTDFSSYTGTETIYMDGVYVYTDSEGDYEVYGLSGGSDYIVSASLYGYGTAKQTQVTVGAGAASVDLALDPVKLGGHVIEATTTGNELMLNNAEITLENGVVQFPDCKRFDYTFDYTYAISKPTSTENVPEIYANVSYWVHPEVGIVKYAGSLFFYGEEYSFETILDDWAVNSDNGEHPDYPLHDGADWSYVGRIKYYSNVSYFNLTMNCIDAEGIWLMDASNGKDYQMSLLGNMYTINDYTYLVNFLFPFGLPSGCGGGYAKQAMLTHELRRIAAAAKAAGTEITEYVVFPMTVDPGSTWPVFSDTSTKISGRYYGLESVTVGNTRAANCSDGYSFSAIEEGKYNVSATAPGYMKDTKQAVNLEPGQNTRAYFALNHVFYANSIVPIKEAALMGYMGQYCYLWDTSIGYGQFVPVGVDDDTIIEPWEGFWITAMEPAVLYYPGAYNESSSVTAGDIGTIAQCTVEPNKWYLISPPLEPKVTSYVSINDAIGDELGYNLYESTWRMAKWWYDASGNMTYTYYNGENKSGSSEPFWFAPGRGFWLYHTNSSPVTLSIENGENTSSGGIYANAVPYTPDATGGDVKAYMSGNPYWFNMKWNECKVAIDSNMYAAVKGDTYVVPKAAKAAASGHPYWHVSLGVESLDGRFIDTYNRAGVLTTEDVDNNYYRAKDLPPMGSNVRIQLSDPGEENAWRYSYDYRPMGLNEYTWDVRVSSSEKEIPARFSIAGFEDVPDEYVLTLLDNESGESWTLGDDFALDLTLSSGEDRIFILTAALKDNEPVTSDDRQLPQAFGILDVRPNPFNPATTIRYSLDTPGQMKIDVYNIYGQHVATIADSWQQAGQHSAVWDASGNSSGIYLVRLSANGRHDTQKITFMK